MKKIVFSRPEIEFCFPDGVIPGMISLLLLAPKLLVVEPFTVSCAGKSEKHWLIAFPKIRLGDSNGAETITKRNDTV